MAEEARRMAKTVSAEEDREALLRIADGFDELADQVDRRNRLDS
jgi:hypothetical protein